MQAADIVQFVERPPLRVDGQNLVYGEPDGSRDWQARQAGGVDRYQAESYEEDPTLARLFGGFIAVGLKPDDVILDVGCGLWPERPLYIRELAAPRFLALEPLTTPVERNYPCLVGVTAETLPLKPRSVDVAVLATSLDHFEDADAGMSGIRRVLAPGGRVMIWAGMCEPEVLAMAKPFWNLTHNGPAWKRTVRCLVPQLDTWTLLWRMRRRARDLARGRPLDNIHFRYDTRESLRRDLGRWGFAIKRELLAPGSNSLFIEARPLEGSPVGAAVASVAAATLLFAATEPG